MSRPKGVITYRSPKNPLAEEAKRNQKQKELQRQERAAARAARPVPNRICYADTAFKGWKPGTRLPKCRRCDAILHPEENHACPGFQPKYAEHDQGWHERQDARREQIRQAKRQREVPTCKWCGIDLPEFDDYDAHMSDGCPEMP